MNKALIAIVIVVVLALGGWAVFGHKSANKTANSDDYGNNSSTQDKSNTTSTSSGSSQAAASGAVDIKT